MIVQGQDQARIALGWPPGMGRAVVLPEFPNGCDLPPATRFWTGFRRRNQMWKVLANVGRDCGPRAVEIEFASQFVGDERKVQWLTVREEISQKISSFLRPDRFMIAAGSCRGKTVFVREPLMTQAIELGLADIQALGGTKRIELARVEGRQNLLNVERGNTVGELFFS